MKKALRHFGTRDECGSSETSSITSVFQTADRHSRNRCRDVYYARVPSSFRHILLATALLALTNCQKTEEPAPSAGVTVIAAQTAIIATQQLLLQTIVSGTAIPGAPLGMYVTNYLIEATGLHFLSAQNGVENSINLLLSNKEKPTESFALLQELGILLQVNVPDMLNRSNDRQQALDSYIDTLTETYDRSQSQLTALKQRQKTALADQRDKRAVTAKIQRDLNLALQKQDYATASTKQTEIIDAKTEQSKAESQVSQLQSTINLFTNLNKIADKRLKAIAANRLVLIAGLQVVNIPGVEDLDVLTNGRVQSGDRPSIFGPTSN